MSSIDPFGLEVYKRILEFTEEYNINITMLEHTVHRIHKNILENIYHSTLEYTEVNMKEY